MWCSMIKVGIGQDSHAINDNSDGKPLILGGIDFGEDYCLEGNSDSDVILHAATNAVSGITGKPVIGPPSDSMCQQGLTDSSLYLKKALQQLAEAGYRVGHVSVSVECQKPRFYDKIPLIRESLARLFSIGLQDTALTATTGEGLTSFGKGKGIQAFCAVTAFTV